MKAVETSGQQPSRRTQDEKGADFSYDNVRASCGHQGQEISHPSLKDELEPMLLFCFSLLEKSSLSQCMSQSMATNCPKLISLLFMKKAKTETQCLKLRQRQCCLNFIPVMDWPSLGQVFTYKPVSIPGQAGPCFPVAISIEMVLRKGNFLRGG